jgi:transcriptional regulator with XRE-family HTH domain
VEKRRMGMRHIMEEYLKNFDTDYIDEVTAMNIQSEFLAYVYNKIKKLGINQNELARRMGVSKSLVSEMLNGNRLLNFKHIAKINRVLGFFTTLRCESKAKYIERVDVERTGCISFGQNFVIQYNYEIPQQKIATFKNNSNWRLWETNLVLPLYSRGGTNGSMH